MRYVFDNCLSYRLAKMLAALDVEAVAVRDLFSESTPDIELLSGLRAGHDVFVTYDHKQKTRAAESRAILEAGVTVLWIGPFWRNKVGGFQQAKWIIDKWERISSFAESVVPGTCAEIKQNGRAMPFKLK